MSSEEHTPEYYIALWKQLSDDDFYTMIQHKLVELSSQSTSNNRALYTLNFFENQNNYFGACLSGVAFEVTNHYDLMLLAAQYLKENTRGKTLFFDKYLWISYLHSYDIKDKQLTITQVIDYIFKCEEDNDTLWFEQPKCVEHRTIISKNGSEFKDKYRISKPKQTQAIAH